MGLLSHRSFSELLFTTQYHFSCYVLRSQLLTLLFCVSDCIEHILKEIFIVFQLDTKNDTFQCSKPIHS